MKKEDMKDILFVIQNAYPRFYVNQTKEQLLQVLDLWTEMFEDYTAKEVAIAVKQVIKTSEFPPTIATITNEINKLKYINNDNEVEYWHEISSAVRNCLYNTQEVFNNLSNIAKSVIGSPEQLKSMALEDSETFQTVTKGQITKQIKSIIEREKYKQGLSNEAKMLIANQTKTNLLE